MTHPASPFPRTALVTGGSRGIGRSVVLRLAADGYDIAFCSRTASTAADETAETVRALGRQCLALTCDVADAESVDTFVKRAEEELGNVHAVVANAGITRDSAVATMTADAWSEVIDTNLSGTFTVLRRTAFGLIKRRAGSIVLMSSVSGVYGHAGQANYAAAKAGVHGLGRSAAKELARSGVRVNVVAPGFIDTDMTAAMPERARELALKSIPLRRFGTAEEVADLTSFLVSDRSAYITGQVMQIDGGVLV